MNPTIYTDDERQIRFVLGLMNDGKAGDWADNYFRERTEYMGNRVPWRNTSFDDFEYEVTKQFTPVDEKIIAQNDFHEIRQGKKSAADFNIDFQRLAILADIADNTTLVERYKRALNPSLAKEIWVRPGGPPVDIQDWYQEAVRRDAVNKQAEALWPRYTPQPWNRPQQPRPQPSRNGNGNGNHRTIHNMESYDEENPDNSEYSEDHHDQTDYETEQPDLYEDQVMQLNAIFTSEQIERFKTGKCIGCRASGHFIDKCPKHDQNLS